MRNLFRNVTVVLLLMGVSGLREAAGKDEATKKANTAPLIWAPVPQPDGSFAYKTVDVEGEKKTLKLFAFFPNRTIEHALKPAIVFFHGGAWTHGSPSMHYQQARHLANRGFMAFSAQYRTYDKDRAGSSPRDCVRDAKSAIRWVRSHADRFGVDPNKIAAGGASAGGHLSAATATLKDYNEDGEELSISSKPNAVVLIEAVLDNGPTRENIRGWGYDIVKDYWETISPYHNIREGHPPTLLVGLLGHTNKYHALSRYAEKVKSVGGISEVYIANKTGPHMAAMLGEEAYPTALRISTFLETHGFVTPTFVSESDFEASFKPASEEELAASLAYLKEAHPRVYGRKGVTIRQFGRANLVTLYQAATDDCIPHLEKMTHMTTMDLRSEALSDLGLERLKDMPHVRHLKLSRSKVTGEGLKHLQDLPHLCALELSRFSQENMAVGLRHVKGIRSLRSLKLQTCEIESEDLDHLLECPSLVKLSLVSYSELSADMIDSLTRFKNLFILNLFRTKVSEEQLDRIRVALPNCEITGL